MTYILRFLPAVTEDIMAAYTWYEEKAIGLGEEFLRIFYAHMASIRRVPLIYSKVHQEFRRGLLQRFPYAVYFRIDSETVIIFGVFHCARNPSIVIESLGNRSV